MERLVERFLFACDCVKCDYHVYVQVCVIYCIYQIDHRLELKTFLSILDFIWIFGQWSVFYSN